MEKILKDLLYYYLGLEDAALEKHLLFVNTATKERVTTINVRLRISYLLNI